MRSSLSVVLTLLFPAAVVAQQVDGSAAAPPADTAAVPTLALVAADAPVAAPSGSALPAGKRALAAVQITGRVLTEQGKPLVGATVYVKELGLAASTDAQGSYVLLVPAGVHTLAFGYGGYAGQQVQASNFLPVTVTLLPADKARKRQK